MIGLMHPGRVRAEVARAAALGSVSRCRICGTYLFNDCTNPEAKTSYLEEPAGGAWA